LALTASVFAFLLVYRYFNWLIESPYDALNDAAWLEWTGNWQSPFAAAIALSPYLATGVLVFAFLTLSKACAILGARSVANRSSRAWAPPGQSLPLPGRPWRSEPPTARSAACGSALLARGVR